MEDQGHHTGSISLIQKLRQEVENNLQNEQFGVEQLAVKMNMSRSQLHRKLKKSTGQSTNQVIREYRLQRALDLLQQGDKTVSEVAFEVGFGGHSYFTTCFKEHYGYPPGEVKNKLLETPDSLGSVQPKGEKLQISWKTKVVLGGLAVLVLLGILWLKQRADAYNREITDKSIAVLPFKNLSGDPEQEAMCDGLTEEIIHHLSRIKSFDKVISRSSVMSLKNSDKTLPEKAALLKVSIVLEGSFQQSGDQIKITAQLIDAVTDNYIWAETYERPIGDIFEIQSDIAKKIAARFNAEITPEEAIRLDKKPTENSEAYILLKKGRHKLGKSYHTGSGIQDAIDLFQMAIEIDSNLAEGYAYLARAYLNASGRSFTGDRSIPAEDPLPLVQKALTLDPELGIAYEVLGGIKHATEWNFKEAEEAYKNALRLDPTLLGYGYFLVQMGRVSETLTFFEKAVKLDPTSSGSLGQLAKFHIYAGNDKRASQIMKEYEFLFPNESYGAGAIGQNYLYMDILDKAIYILEKVEGVPLYRAYLAIAYAKNGQHQKAVKVMEPLIVSQEKDTRSLNFSIGLYYSGTGQVEEALHWLERAYVSLDMELYWLKTEPFFKPLHGNPRYEELLRKIGFPEN